MLKTAEENRKKNQPNELYDSYFKWHFGNSLNKYRNTNKQVELQQQKLNVMESDANTDVMAQIARRKQQLNQEQTPN